MAKKISIKFDASKGNLGDQFGLTYERSKELQEKAGKLVSATEAKNPLYLIEEIAALCTNQQELAFCMVNVGYNRSKQIARREARELKERQAQQSREREFMQRERNKRPYDYILNEARAAVVHTFTTNAGFNACVNAGLQADVSVHVEFKQLEEEVAPYSRAPFGVPEEAMSYRKFYEDALAKVCAAHGMSFEEYSKPTLADKLSQFCSPASQAQVYVDGKLVGTASDIMLKGMPFSAGGYVPGMKQASNVFKNGGHIFREPEEITLPRINRITMKDVKMNDFCQRKGISTIPFMRSNKENDILAAWSDDYNRQQQEIKRIHTIIEECTHPWKDDIAYMKTEGGNLQIKFKNTVSEHYAKGAFCEITRLLQHRLPGGVPGE